VEKSLEELAFSIKVQTLAMQHIPHTFLTLIKAGLFLATSLAHDGNGRLVSGSPASSKSSLNSALPNEGV
jgi:hypothetical protein